MFYIDNEKCNGCGTCIEVCPQDAIIIEGEKAAINQEVCNECGSCLEACPKGAIYEVRVPAEVYDVKAAPVAQRPAVASKKRSGLTAALVGLAPVAIDFLSSLSRGWLSSKSERRDAARGSRFGPSPGGRRRWRGGRR